MNDDEVHAEPSEVTADDSKVAVKGPDSVDVKLTPEAAIETGGRLIDAGAHVVGRKRLKAVDQRPD